MTNILREMFSPQTSDEPSLRSSSRVQRYYERGQPDFYSWRQNSEHQASRCSSWLNHNLKLNSVSPPPIDLPFRGGITMERTPSGNAILSTSSPELLPDIKTLPIHQKEDIAAAVRVESYFRRRSQDSKHERILRKLIRRDEPLDSGFTLDELALDSILTAADTLFFDGVLAGRVKWEWSSDLRYRTEIIGTTALRRCIGREGFETLIVLSEPVLRDERYDRRLLLSAFLHELIHSYLFISCGFKARMDGGHTAGFYRIAKVIDSWVGPSFLSICKLREDPERFHKPNRTFQSYEKQARDPRWETSQYEKLDANRDLMELLPVQLPSHQNCNQSLRYFGNRPPEYFSPNSVVWPSNRNNSIR